MFSCYATSLFYYFFEKRIHSPITSAASMAFAVMNLNYAKVTFHCGDLSAALLEMAGLPHCHDHAY